MSTGREPGEGDVTRYVGASGPDAGVMCACGPVKPGEERKPWVGERVHEHECECRVEKQRYEMQRTMERYSTS